MGGQQFLVRSKKFGEHLPLPQYSSLEKFVRGGGELNIRRPGLPSPPMKVWTWTLATTILSTKPPFHLPLRHSQLCVLMLALVHHLDSHDQLTPIT